ncbi:carotenoid ester lipase precursor [Phanerochaete sordida]|uniref:Carotenoid ester lipase n=1 Tax=Phanerochaete sordida TaxID=48140 RepID=A0A9P3GF81_9APHY|nr:carotenoid ester lipase precursor [Phanerochaete sordida]
MHPLPALLAALAAHASLSTASASPSAPTVTLDRGTFTGGVDGPTHHFLGIPYAQPPVGDLRFRLPRAPEPYIGAHDATAFGRACTQQDTRPQFPASINSSVTQTLTMNALAEPSGEDCLTLDVWMPADVEEGAKLPVVVWMFGGGFEVGGTSLYNASTVVSRSIEMNQPIVYVGMNYRLSLFGFLGGKEVKESGVANLGLQDQREALRWVQRYIAAFHGDPSKVTLWGQSAGAISAGLHLLAHDGDARGLFRGAFMQSGSPLPVRDVASPADQARYDAVVGKVGCAGAEDTLACLRGASFEELKSAADKSPGLYGFESLNIAWQPRVDGVFLTADPWALIQDGAVADVPFVSGDCDDEGTVFAMPSLNLTTDAQTAAYIHSTYLPASTPSQLRALLALYPSAPGAGSPFGVGLNDSLTPQYKRLAALQGDLAFHAPRRVLLGARAARQPAWTYLSKREKDTPGLGSAHTTDLFNSFGGGDLTDVVVNFVNHLDPNGAPSTNASATASGTLPYWPRYDTERREVLVLLDGDVTAAVQRDDFREAGIALAGELVAGNPF